LLRRPEGIRVGPAGADEVTETGAAKERVWLGPVPRDRMSAIVHSKTDGEAWLAAEYHGARGFRSRRRRGASRQGEFIRGCGITSSAESSFADTLDTDSRHVAVGILPVPRKNRRCATSCPSCWFRPSSHFTSLSFSLVFSDSLAGPSAAPGARRDRLRPR
jgi:hypothetical protein